MEQHFTINKAPLKKLKNHVLTYMELLEAGCFLEVIDTFYHPNITQIENYEPAIIGKEKLRQIELDNLDRIDQVSCKIFNHIVDEKKGLVMGEMYIEFTSRKLGKMLLEEAFVQKWVEGQILYQRFYYKDFQLLMN